MGEEFIAEALALGCALNQARDINKFDRCVRRFGRLVKRCEFVEPLVRHIHDADIRLDGAKRIVCGLRARVGDGIKQGAFADVRQPYNSKLHVISSSSAFEIGQKIL